ncbi:MAG TPA: hypothetical protein VNJ04_05085 [Gemmatimonadaceae bacterium]|nr:hypothetical protein [Gemmatimonadaceae bacterium]
MSFEEFRRKLAGLGAEWVELESADLLVLEGYFHRIGPHGRRLLAPFRLPDRRAGVHPDLMQHVYGRLGIVENSPSTN